ncbi:MAG: hypothetical protein FWF72_01420 [Paludibacter sp.]|nr:hypothetical protein [Paludibacter sp.]
MRTTELDKILGGGGANLELETPIDEIDVEARIVSEINNKNSVASCVCTYKNKQTLTNSNSVELCRCICV